MPKYNSNPTPLEVARRAAGLTRKQLAEKAGVPFRSLECYEQGKNNINGAAVVTVKALAEALGVPIEKILNDDE